LLTVTLDLDVLTYPCIMAMFDERLKQTVLAYRSHRKLSTDGVVACQVMAGKNYDFKRE